MRHSLGNKKKDTTNIVIGKHMTELRSKFNLSQKEICQVIGVNRIHIKITK